MIAVTESPELPLSHIIYGKFRRHRYRFPFDSGRRDQGDWRDRARCFAKSDFVRSFPFWFIPFSIMGLGVYGGIGWNTLISLTDYEGFQPPDFTDLDFDMYVQALQDPAVILVTKNTFVLMVAFTTITMILGLFSRSCSTGDQVPGEGPDHLPVADGAVVRRDGPVLALDVQHQQRPGQRGDRPVRAGAVQLDRQPRPRARGRRLRTDLAVQRLRHGRVPGGAAVCPTTSSRPRRSTARARSRPTGESSSRSSSRRR